MGDETVHERKISRAKFYGRRGRDRPTDASDRARICGGRGGRQALGVDAGGAEAGVAALSPDAAMVPDVGRFAGVSMGYRRDAVLPA